MARYHARRTRGRAGRESLRPFYTGGGVAAPPPSPAPPPTPAPPSAPPVSPAPPAQPTDAAYEGRIASNEAERQRVRGKYGNPSAASGASFQERYGTEGVSLAQKYGFEGFGDPYSLAKQLERSFQMQNTGTANSLAAQGQLYSGHMDTELGDVNRRYQQGYADLERDYQSGLSGISETAAGALYALGQGDIDAFEELLGRLSQNEPDPQGTSNFTPVGPYAPGGVWEGQGLENTWVADPAWQDPINNATLNFAKSLWDSGQRSGKKWRSIIDQLGYDPRDQWR